jgi:hypothetical protein
VEREQLERHSAARRPTVAPAPTSDGGRAGAMLALQRTAGNAAVASTMDVQREGLDDVFGPNPFGEGGQEPAPGDGGDPETPAAPTGTDPSGGINELGPIARTGTLIADTVIASSYTPGAGNIW